MHVKRTSYMIEMETLLKDFDKEYNKIYNTKNHADAGFHKVNVGITDRWQQELNLILRLKSKLNTIKIFCAQLRHSQPAFIMVIVIKLVSSYLFVTSSSTLKCESIHLVELIGSRDIYDPGLLCCCSSTAALAGIDY
jgi:hypothetical protein